MKPARIAAGAGATAFLVVGALVAGGGAPAAAPLSPGPLSADLVGAYAYGAGFRGPGLVLAIAVSSPESGRDPARIGVNPPNPASSHPCGRSGSRDRGLWQINDCYHPDVDDACAFEPVCSAAAAFRISGGGTVWRPWATFNDGLHLPFMVEATNAAARAPFVALPGPALLGAYALPLPRERVTERGLLVPHHDYPAWDGPTPAGTPVYAIAAGTVTATTNDGRCGIGVIVASAGHVATYCHGAAVFVAAGQGVVAGQRIMASGSSGESSGPHLHLQVEVEGRKVCPQPVLYAWFKGVPASFAAAPTGGCIG